MLCAISVFNVFTCVFDVTDYVYPALNYARQNVAVILGQLLVTVLTGIFENSKFKESQESIISKLLYVEYEVRSNQEDFYIAQVKLVEFLRFYAGLRDVCGTQIFRSVFPFRYSGYVYRRQEPM